MPRRHACRKTAANETHLPAANGHGHFLFMPYYYRNLGVSVIIAV